MNLLSPSWTASLFIYTPTYILVRGLQILAVSYPDSAIDAFLFCQEIIMTCVICLSMNYVHLTSDLKKFLQDLEANTEWQEKQNAIDDS